MFQQWISAEIRCEKAAFCSAKRLLLGCKKGVIGMQKGCFWYVI